MRSKFFSELIFRHPGTDYATVIRGLAALAVLGTHGGGVLPLIELSEFLGFGGDVIQNLGNLGSAGPAAFFITSGFVLSLVWKKQNKNGFKKWVIRRYLRLTPLYLVILVVCILQGTNISTLDFLLRMLYLDAFYEPLFNRAPLGVLWTLAIEFWLSLLIPFFVFVFQKLRRPELFLVLTFLASSLGPVFLMKFGVGDLMAWKSLLSSVFCFAVGSYLSTIEKSEHASRAFRLMIVFSIGFTLLYMWDGYMGSWWVTILFTSSYLGYRATSEVNSKPSNGLLVWLGTICYGVYLTHMPVLASFGSWGSNWTFYLALLPVLFLSSLSWLFIEKPISRLYKHNTQKPGH